MPSSFCVGEGIIANRVSPPPMDLIGLEQWLDETGVRECLDDSCTATVPWDAGGLLSTLGCARLRDLLDLSTVKRTPRLRSNVSIAAGHIARSYLYYRAVRAAVLQRRSQTWAQIIEPKVLQDLVDVLRATLAPLCLPSQPSASVVVYDTATMTVDRAFFRVSVTITRSEFSRSCVASATLSRWQSGAVPLSCSCGRVGPCPHVRVLLEWTLDALCDDACPHRGLRQALLDQVSTPSWKRVLDIVEGFSAQGSKQAREERLVWEVSHQGNKLTVTPKASRRCKSGRWSKPTGIGVTELLSYRRTLLGAEDFPVAAAVLAASNACPWAAAQEHHIRALDALVDHPRVVLPGPWHRSC
ncbi:MAG: hypothetical protein MUF54_25200, partial [Polyangiaceae bacterium]|nr:hypothetical protein [Polyangiaceae bacterium]